MRYGGTGDGTYGGAGRVIANGVLSNSSFTGVASFASGSAAAPSITFTSDPLTGLFVRTAPAGLGFAVSGGVACGPTAADALAISSVGAVSWSSGAWGAVTDTRLTRQAAGRLCLNGGIATPAGGSAAMAFVFGATSGFGIYIGSGAPTVSAAQGSIYLRSDGSSTSTRLYVNTNGTTGWTNVTTAA